MMKSDQSSPEEYDFVILGTGEGAKYAAWTFARQGKRVAAIDRKYIGGSCPNIACLPSKNIIHSAKVASYFRSSEEFGITRVNFKINMSGVRDRKRKMVAGLVDIHLANFKASGAELIMGSARFIGPKTLEVTLLDGGTRFLRGNKVIISTGTHATIEPIPGLSESSPLTHVEALELDVIPEHLLVLGGGFIGLELAQAMRRFGSRVTILDRNQRLAHQEDEDVSAALHDLCRDEGIELEMSARVTSVEGKSGQSVKLRVVQGESETILEGTHLLVATGRTSNNKGIGLELAGVELTNHGYIKVNERLETTAPDVWAIGECAGSPQFTHIAFDDFRVVRDNLAGGHRVTTGRQVPFCLFTDPELARIGLGETEAKERGIPYRLAKIPMATVLRTHTLSETRGFMKALVDTKSDRILGFTVFGVAAGEIMATVQVAMIAGLPYTVLRDAIFTHPTLQEGFIPLFSTIPPGSHETGKNAITPNATGVVDLPCNRSVVEVVDHLESLLEAKGIKVFSRIDQAAEARTAGLTMRPTVLLIFGDPKTGTPLMDRYPSIAIDLPLKALVWESSEGKVWLSYNSPEFLQQRHRLDTRPFEAIGNLLQAATQ
jgi:pyruvate/2-oxoglutarate dehydrogenase complex dihydrolipoamide dehydrogenase (E3) component/uncharacterized protein (DUF302 family)